MLTLAIPALVTALAASEISVHGHRGARARFPENTIPAFEHAIRAGANVLELDLAVTKDDVLVVSHDPFLHAPMCKGPVERVNIRELTFHEIRTKWDCGSIANPQFPKQATVPGTRMPSLDEVLQLASKSSKLEFNIETKISPARPELTPSPDVFAELLVRAIEKHKLVGRCMIQSFDFRTLIAARKLNPKIRLSALYQGGPKDYVTLSKEAANAEIVSPQFPGVTAEKVKAAHAAGLKVVPWTANKPEEWDKLIAAGVDAIITDDPEALIQHLRAGAAKRR
jgi:glycerophosphoryl diester phosphodiesterase